MLFILEAYNLYSQGAFDAQAIIRKTDKKPGFLRRAFFAASPPTEQGYQITLHVNGNVIGKPQISFDPAVEALFERNAIKGEAGVSASFRSTMPVERIGVVPLIQECYAVLYDDKGKTGIKRFPDYSMVGI